MLTSNGESHLTELISWFHCSHVLYNVCFQNIFHASGQIWVQLSSYYLKFDSWGCIGYWGDCSQESEVELNCSPTSDSGAWKWLQSREWSSPPAVQILTVATLPAPRITSWAAEAEAKLHISVPRWHFRV